MLNERKEINKLFSSGTIKKNQIYKSCYLLGKHYKQMGLNEIKAREEIGKWARQRDIYLNTDLNIIISRAYYDNKPIIENIAINISEKDIVEINRRFDRKNTKLLAFALLCYAKLHASSDGIINISLKSVSDWTGINRVDFYRNYGLLQELEDFDYVIRLNGIVPTIKKSKNTLFKSNSILKLCVDYSNKGRYTFFDNNIREEFEEIFKQSKL